MLIDLCWLRPMRRRKVHLHAVIVECASALSVLRTVLRVVIYCLPNYIVAWLWRAYGRRSEVFAESEYFNGPDRAVSSTCVCLCVRTITVELNDLWLRHLASWFILTMYVWKLRSWIKWRKMFIYRIHYEVTVHFEWREGTSKRPYNTYTV